MTNKVATHAVSIAILMQIPAGIVATAVCKWLEGKWIIPVIVLVNIVIVSALITIPSGVTVFSTLSLFGFLWFFIVPFQMSALADLDTSKRAMMLSGTAQMLGGSSGAAVSAFAVATWGLPAAAAVAVFLFVASGLAIVFAWSVSDCAPRG